ncbi:MAG: Gfo/Idh/MocA family protein [Armatimonadota bacterium]
MEKLLVVGCGSIGERHIRCLKHVNDVQITPCDPRQGRLQEMQQLYGTQPGIADYSEADLSEFDAVLICTPTYLHIPQSLRAIETGCHLFVEKPISVDMEGVEDLIAGAEEADLVIQVGYVLRHHPLIRRARQLIDEGAIGIVQMADIWAGSYIPDARPEYASLYWAKSSTGGGVLYNASHELDLINWLVGPVTQVSCFAELYTLDVDEDVNDAAVMSLLTENNAIVSFNCADMQRNYKRGGQIIGSDGTIEYSYDESRVSLYRADDETWIHEERTFERDHFYINQMRNFCAAIHGYEKPAVDIYDGRLALAVALAGQLSSMEKRFVSISELLPASRVSD